MRVYRGLHTLSPANRGLSLTIGNFDGVHIGHQKIIRQVIEGAESLGTESGVMIFEPQPREFFAPEEAPPRLMSMRQKLERMDALGITTVICMPFRERFRSLTAQGFVEDVLVRGLGLRYLVIGDDFRFGCDRQGNFSLLQKEGEMHGYRVVRTESVVREGRRVSSTWIREALARGDVELASRLLGQPYEIEGRVAHGQKLGRTLGFPTANLNLKRPPAVNGVWAVEAWVASRGWVGGVANIGRRPTVSGDGIRLEVHLFDVALDLYGQRLRVRLLEKLRNEQRFSGIDELKLQLERDSARARRILASPRESDIS